MGLVSYIKDFFYNKRLEKAENLLIKGNTVKAEQIFYSLLDKHPLSAAKLADYYMSLAQQANNAEAIKLFDKTVEIEKKGGSVYDVKSYDEVLIRFGNSIFQRARTSFESESYLDSFSLLKSLNSSKCKSDDSIKLQSESRIKLIFHEIESIKSTDQRFDDLINDFKKEWSIVQSQTRAKQTSLVFCEQLMNIKRFYAATLLLDIIHNDKTNTEILDNVKQIVFGNDIEVSASQIKDIISAFGKNAVLRKDIAQKDAVSLFDKSWSSSYDCRFVMDVVIAANEVSLRDAIISHMLANHKSYFSVSKLYNEFSEWGYSQLDSPISLQLLENLHALGYNTEKFYVAKLHSWITAMPIDQQIVHLDHAQTLFPDSDRIIDDKLECSRYYLDNNENDKAIAVAESIIPVCNYARTIKSSALCNLAEIESDTDKKVTLLAQAKDVLGNDSSVDFIKVRTLINSSLVSAAENYYVSKELKKSHDILDQLSKERFEPALFSIAKHRLNELKECSSSSDRLKKAIQAIEEIRTYNISSITKNDDYLSIWDEYLFAFIDVRSSLDNSEAISDYEKILKDIDLAGFNSSETKKKQGVIIKQIISRKYLIARDLELANKIEEATDLYKEINKLESKKTPTLSALRFIICKLKSENYSDILSHKDQIYALLRNSVEAFKQEKEDIAYRFALILLKSGEDKEALSVLTEFLPNEDYLKKACEQGAMIKAQAKLEDFNNKINAVQDKTLSSKDAIYFVNHILEYAEIIKPILDISRTDLRKYRDKLRNYAIYKLFEEEQYAIAFEKMLKEHPDYLNDLTALRNIALVCLNMAESGQISESNYQKVISVWLTAIYQEQLFIKSLDYTSWDDQYNFSLDEAYGHFNEDSVGDLPDNVNFDYYDPDDDKTVYIKDVQRALLDRFEAAISENQLYHEFFTDQKDAMDSFIALNLDRKCRLVSPYLAQQDNDVYEDICDALEQDREQNYDNWEDVISVGALYQIDKQIYIEYKDAKDYYKSCIDAINSNIVSDAKKTFVKTKITSIRRFQKLNSALISYVNSKVSALSAKNTNEFKDNFSFYIIVCNALNDKTLSFIFSKYVMSSVVDEVNAKRISLAKASSYILPIYLLDPTNSKVKENLTTLFEMLVIDESSESKKAVSDILNKIKVIDSTLHQQYLFKKEDGEVALLLHDIVDKVNSNTISKANALDKVYAIYKTKPNNARVCTNLATLSSMCVVDYVMTQKTGYTSVERTLDLLKNNRSPEFKKYASEFKDAYDSLWDNMPDNLKILISYGGKVGTTTLNEQGYAIMRGLKYLEALGGFTGQTLRPRFGGFSSLY